MEDKDFLTYDPSKLPAPVTIQDAYLHAILVELRANRRVLEELTRAVNKLVKAEQTQARVLSRK